MPIDLTDRGALERQLSDEELLEIADLSDQRDFLSEQQRIRYLADSVETVDEYLLVVALADSVPQTDLIAQDILATDTTEELLFTITEAHLDTLVIEELFEKHTVDTKYTRHSLEVQTDFPEPKPGMDLDERNDFELATKTIDSQRYRCGHMLAPANNQYTLPNRLEELVKILFQDIHTIVMQGEQISGSVLDAIDQLESNGYLPDTMVVGDDVEVGADSFYGIGTILESERVGSNELYIADTDLFGISTVFSEPSIELSNKYARQSQTFIRPLHYQLIFRKNWCTRVSDALVRTKAKEIPGWG